MLEQFLASVNSNVFLREFSFSHNTFRPRPGEEVEFADHVIWVDDLLMLYQLKERSPVPDVSPDTERRWFKRKVLRDATKQVRDTLRYLDTQADINLTNQRGHQINIKDSSSTRIIKIVVYAANVALPDDCLRIRHYQSSSGGFMHVVSQPDYLGVCQTLITPGEIAEYFEFREELISYWTNRAEIPSEVALVGQFLETANSQEEPREEYRYNLHSLREATDAPEFTAHARSSTPSSKSFAADALGAFCPTTSCLVKPSTITCASGAWMVPGRGYTPLCASGCEYASRETLSPAPG